MSTTGKLTLVGAGPGDPELISVKGVKAIASADVILYDALVNPELLEYAGKGCIKLHVGKRAGKFSTPQEEINNLIVRYALEGHHVVRLKGGDPFIFARGKEEIEYAETFGIETQVVIGISSINLPGHYGIPLTTRGVNQSFWAVTATNRFGELSDDARLAAQSSATVVFFMGLNKLREIVDLYQSFGKYELPLAIISQGSLPNGKVVFGTISTILEEDISTIPAPALIVVGESVGEHQYFYQTLKVQVR